ncbi:hypothetical protein Vadar_009093 [Vaccinium darrowii]|uniref:Uncharacterized protein n=1 Tax=Vaccinium darrowii TaxID=229202 RepID=A0ACB7YDQ3_9ERIC|nr:hypothetical protein Vadar_009093 [Vaccinium darrowii]
MIHTQPGLHNRAHNRVTRVQNGVVLYPNPTPKKNTLKISGSPSPFFSPGDHDRERGATIGNHDPTTTAAAAVGRTPSTSGDNETASKGWTLVQVLELESLFLNRDCFRDDLAHLLRAVQAQEKSKLQLTATIQVLKKAGRPSERLVSHENCSFKKPMQHECVHVHEITEAAGTEEAEADAEYDNALKEAINENSQDGNSKCQGKLQVSRDLFFFILLVTKL